MGPAEGVMTDLLFPKFSDDYTVVDGADFFVNDLKKRYPNINGFVSLFEDFVPENNKKYDNIVLGCTRTCRKSCKYSKKMWNIVE